MKRGFRGHEASTDISCADTDRSCINRALAAKFNWFNVSFELNQTHDVVVDPGNGVNGTLTVRTFDGALTTSLIRYSKPYSVNSTWVQDRLTGLFKAGVPTEFDND